MALEVRFHRILILLYVGAEIPVRVTVPGVAFWSAAKAVDGVKPRISMTAISTARRLFDFILIFIKSSLLIFGKSIYSISSLSICPVDTIGQME